MNMLNLACRANYSGRAGISNFDLAIIQLPERTSESLSLAKSP
jgi:hypothetical protein